jgi:GT2 family glycosyltransferase
VAVVVVTFNSCNDVADCFGSLGRALAGNREARVIAVDNASADGTVDRIRRDYPWVDVLPCDRNLGFAAGNNLGIRRALDAGCSFVYLLNPDTEVRQGFLDEAMGAALARPDAGAVQSLLLLHDQPDLVNSAGNQVHYLGFGYCGSFRRPARDVPDEVREIPFASGAAVLLRAEALATAGLLDDDLFLYQEDLDLGWRMRLAGWTAVLAPRSRVLHKYAFARGAQKLYYLERNRPLVLLKNLRWRTLAILFPLLLAADLGILLLALWSGWAGTKLRAMAYLLRPAAWRHVRRGRREQARIRKIPDSELVRHFTPSIEFEEMAGRQVGSVLNPVLASLWSLLRRCIP